jgi:hypothetical protein
MEFRQALGEEEITIARGLFRDYQAELGIELCFQVFAAELSGLPGDYSPPAGSCLSGRTASRWDASRCAASGRGCAR